MFDEKTLKELASTQVDGPLLSVYLNVDSTRRSTEEYKLKLRKMLKQIHTTVHPDDVEAIKRYVDLEYDGSGRGLVIFSHTATDIWQAFPLAIPVRSGITVSTKPYISPLVELHSLYGRYAVALIDRQGGRFFLFEMGRLITQEGTVGTDIRRTRKGRGSSVVGMRGGSPASGRKEAELVQRNLKGTAVALADFCQQYQPHRLLLAGAEHTIAQFHELLPASLKNMVEGTFIANMEANEVTIRERSFTTLTDLAAVRKQTLVKTTITAAAKGQNGVIGLGPTLNAAHEGRVQVLVVERDYHTPGYHCTGCGYLTEAKLNTCVFCEGEFSKIADAIEAVVTQVIEKGGTIEVVEDNALGESHIGALLRY